VKYVRKDRFTSVPAWRHQSAWPPRTVHANGMLDATPNLFCHGYIQGSWDPGDMRLPAQAAAWAGGSSYVPPPEAWPSAAWLHTEGCAFPNWSAMQYMEGGPVITLGSDATMPGGFLKMTPRLMTTAEKAVLPAAMMSAANAPKYLGPAFNTFPYGMKYGLHAVRMRVPGVSPGWPALWLLSDFQDTVNEIDTNDKFGWDYRTSNQGIIFRMPDGSEDDFGGERPDLEWPNRWRWYATDFGPDLVIQYIGWGDDPSSMVCTQFIETPQTYKNTTFYPIFNYSMTGNPADDADWAGGNLYMSVSDFIMGDRPEYIAARAA
ncbi:hypothetical protein M0638_27810, partial [Roseomonas sp. NAR14]